MQIINNMKITIFYISLFVLILSAIFYFSSSALGSTFINANLAMPTLNGTTISFGNAILLAGACTSTPTTVAGATTGMTVTSDPVTYPGDGVVYESYVSSANVITTKACAIVGLTPTASVYNLRVMQ